MLLFDARTPVKTSSTIRGCKLANSSGDSRITILGPEYNLASVEVPINRRRSASPTQPILKTTVTRRKRALPRQIKNMGIKAMMYSNQNDLWNRTDSPPNGGEETRERQAGINCREHTAPFIAILRVGDRSSLRWGRLLFSLRFRFGSGRHNRFSASRARDLPPCITVFTDDLLEHSDKSNHKSLIDDALSGDARDSLTHPRQRQAQNVSVQNVSVQNVRVQNVRADAS